MPLYRQRFITAWSIALAACVISVAPSFGDEPRSEPIVESIEIEVESLEAPGLRDLKRTGQYPPPTFATPGGLPPEILRVQQELGGSVVNQFPALHATESPAPTSASPSKNPEAVVEALRDAAWTMDSWANRLEKLQAYKQADALRDHAQRLRLEARTLAAPVPADGTSSAPATSAVPDLAPQIEITPSPVVPTPTELR